MVGSGAAPVPPVKRDRLKGETSSRRPRPPAAHHWTAGSSARHRRPPAWHEPRPHCERDHPLTESLPSTLYATLHTNHGDIRIQLYPDHAPKTVRNFVELAE